MQPPRYSERSRRRARIRGLSLARRILPGAAVVLAVACQGGAPLESRDATVRATRIVSLTPNVTEMIHAVGCGDRLVAVDSNSDYPPDVRGLPDVGGMNPSIERILAANPDAVVGSAIGAYERIAEQLEARGVRYLSVSAERLRDVPPAMESLKAALDCSGGAELIRAIRAMDQRVEPDAPSVLVLASVDPLFVAGRGTFLDDLLVSAGAVNALPADVTGWPAYSIEAVLANPPDVVLVLSSSERWPATKERIESAPGWKDLEAVRERRTGMLDESIATRPGPRVLETRELIAAALQRMVGR